MTLKKSLPTWWYKITLNKLIKFIKTLQIGSDPTKIKLERDEKLDKFINLILDYPESLSLLYIWKKNRSLMIIPLQKDINYLYIKKSLEKKVNESFYLSNFIFNLREQYSNFEEDPEKISRLVTFLKKCIDSGLLIEKSEKIYLCQNCGNLIISYKKLTKCSCGLDLDCVFYLGSFSSSIIKSIELGHLTELLTLKILKRSKSIELIGFTTGDEKTVYTSIQYAGIGAEKSSNGEFDLFGMKAAILLFIECKFNQTIPRDIKDFLQHVEKMLSKIKNRFKKENLNLKHLNIIVSYDASKLTPLPNTLIVSLNKESIKNLEKKINLNLASEE